MTPTQPNASHQVAASFSRPRFDAEAARLLRDIEALKERCQDPAGGLPWNTYFDELIQRGPRPEMTRD